MRELNVKFGQMDGESKNLDGHGETTTSSRRTFLKLAGAGTAVSLAGCIGGAESTGMLESVTYRHRFKRIGLVPSLHDAGEKFGTWEDAGLSVDFLSSSGSQETAKAVAAGENHFGDGGMGAILKAIEDGAPLVILGQELDPIRGIVTLKENDINSWKDLEGKTIGKFPFAITDMVEEAMKRKGVDVSTIEFQNVSPSASFQMLIEGKLDALSRYVPQAVDELEYKGHPAVGFYTSNVIDYLGPCVYTRKSMVEEHPETVRAFMEGWLKNFKLFANKTDKVIEAYKPLVSGDFNEELERKTLPELFAAQAPKREIGNSHGKGWITADRMKTTVNTFHEAGIIDSTSPIESYYSEKFLAQNQKVAIDSAKAIYNRLEQYDIGPDYV
ncbi:MAG: ABC transporter substrate-binding protein [Halobacteriaceae archaeon]